MDFHCAMHYWTAIFISVLLMWETSLKLYILTFAIAADINNGDSSRPTYNYKISGYLVDFDVYLQHLIMYTLSLFDIEFDTIYCKC